MIVVIGEAGLRGGRPLSNLELAAIGLLGVVLIWLAVTHFSAYFGLLRLLARVLQILS